MGAIFFHFTNFLITRNRLRKYLNTHITALNTPFIIPYATSIIISLIISLTPSTIAEFIITVAEITIISVVITIAEFTIIAEFTVIAVIITITPFTITISFTTIAEFTITVATTTISAFTATVAFTTIAQEYITVITYAVIVLESVIIMGAPSSALPFVPSLGALRCPPAVRRVRVVASACARHSSRLALPPVRAVASGLSGRNPAPPLAFVPEFDTSHL